MSDQNDRSSETEAFPITESKPGFELHELTNCPDCNKPNGPNRRSCIYCGKALAITDRNSRGGEMVGRGLEDWKSGVNLIAVPAADRETNIGSAAGLLGIEGGVLSELLDKQTPLPLARVESKEFADELSANLRGFGIDIRAIGDSEIDAEHRPIRLRSIEVDKMNIGFVDFNTGEVYAVDASDVSLIVAGSLVESRREEVTQRRRGSTKILDEFEEANDQRVLDIYTSQNGIGFRIQTNGFDFSVLGDQKELFASKNMIRLQAYFLTLFPNAVIADEYDSIRDLLDITWPDTISKDLHGLQIRSYGKREFGATYTTSNLSQFTKYSRMRWLLI